MRQGSGDLRGVPQVPKSHRGSRVRRWYPNSSYYLHCIAALEEPPILPAPLCKLAISFLLHTGRNCFRIQPRSDFVIQNTIVFYLCKKNRIMFKGNFTPPPPHPPKKCLIIPPVNTANFADDTKSPGQTFARFLGGLKYPLKDMLFFLTANNGHILCQKYLY